MTDYDKWFAVVKPSFSFLNNFFKCIISKEDSNAFQNRYLPFIFTTNKRSPSRSACISFWFLLQPKRRTRTKGKQTMVRVGGGFMDLPYYLHHHVPIKVYQRQPYAERSSKHMFMVKSKRPESATDHKQYDRPSWSTMNTGFKAFACIWFVVELYEIAHNINYQSYSVAMGQEPIQLEFYWSKCSECAGWSVRI